MVDRIASYRDLNVFQNAMNAAMKLFEVTKGVLASMEMGQISVPKSECDRYPGTPFNRPS